MGVMTNHDYLYHTQTAQRASGTFHALGGAGLLDAFSGVYYFSGQYTFLFSVSYGDGFILCSKMTESWNERGS